MLLSSRAALAQVGGHPTAGTPQPTNLLLSPDKRISPLLNQPDGSWNFGDAAAGTLSDRGANLTPLTRLEIETSLTLANIQVVKAWGIKPGSDNKIRNYVGRLKRVGESPPDEQEAHFEVLVPVSYTDNLQKPTLLVLSTYQTISSSIPANIPFDPHLYPAQPVLTSAITISTASIMRKVSSRKSVFRT